MGRMSNTPPMMVGGPTQGNPLSGIQQGAWQQALQHLPQQQGGTPVPMAMLMTNGPGAMQPMPQTPTMATPGPIGPNPPMNPQQPHPQMQRMMLARALMNR